MLSQGALAFLMPWVSALLLVEMTLDTGALGSTLHWWRTGTVRAERRTLTVAVAVTLVHAVRVFIFAMGRIGPWTDFDVRPTQRALHSARWSWGDVYLASGLSALSIVAVVVIWWLRKGRAGADRGGVP